MSALLELGYIATRGELFVGLLVCCCINTALTLFLFLRSDK